MTRLVIVTGASRGIGAGTARLAARAGWSVGINYRTNPAMAKALVAEIEDAGGRAIALPGDVAIECDVRALFDDAERAFGPVRALVNNAGIMAPPSRLADMDVARWHATFATNTFGTFLCTREAVRRMALSNGGTGGAIVNVSSMAAVLGGANEVTDYAASKGAVDSLTVGLSREVAADGIRVNGVRPGLIDTDIHPDDRVAKLMSTVPMQRVGTCDEVARTILWLLSDDASYCTGTTINVSGGR